MKLEETNISAMNSEEFKTIEFRVDQKMAQLIFRDKLYSTEGRLRVIAQEYMANARDAHRAAGKSDTPIEVTLPTSLAPEFIVRDFGKGIPPSVVEDIFVVYGASTKKTSNEQNGGYGIGAKCAFSYVNAFSVTTIVEGTRYIYAASIDSDGMNQFVLMDTSPTTDLDGTEVRVPIKSGDIVALRDWVYKVSHAWNPRPVIKASSLEYRTPLVDEVGDRWQLYRNADPFGYNVATSGITVTVDDIPYSITQQQATDISPEVSGLSAVLAANHYLLVMNFKVGEVTIPPQRESIDLTPRTKESIQKAALIIIKVFVDRAMAKVSQAVGSLSRIQLSFNTGIDMAICRRLGESVQNDAAYGATFDASTAGMKVYAFRRNHGRFMRFNQTENLTLKWLASTGDSGRDGGCFVVDALGTSMSLVSLKRLVSSNAGNGNGRVIVVSDAKLFEATIGTTLKELSGVGYVMLVKPPKAIPKQRAEVKSGYIFVPQISIGYSSYSNGQTVTNENAKTFARPGWTTGRIWVNYDHVKSAYKVKDLHLDQQSLGNLSLVIARLSCSAFSSVKLYVWQDRFNDYCNKEDCVFIDGWIDRSVTSALSNPPHKLAEIGHAGLVPYEQSKRWALGSRANSPTSLLTELGYSKEFGFLMEHIADIESGTRQVQVLTDSWDMFESVGGKQLGKAIKKACLLSEEARVEFDKLAYSKPILPMLFAALSSGTYTSRLRERGWTWEDLIKEQLAGRKPRNSKFKATTSVVAPLITKVSP